jgi:hypothetical protein
MLNGTERKPFDTSKMKKLPTYQSIYKRMDHQDDAEERLRKEEVDEAVELSSSRKTKVNALLAKHQAKGLPAKPSKKYTREYTGDGLPQIMATINQEETLNETKE